MTNERVKPLFEDTSAPSELRELVALARADGPTQAELNQLASRIAPELGGALTITALKATALGSPPADIASAAPLFAASKPTLFTKLLSSTSAKILAAAGLSVGIGAALWSYAPSPPSSAPAAAPIMVPAQAPPPQPGLVRHEPAPDTLTTAQAPGAEAATSTTKVDDVVKDVATPEGTAGAAQRAARTQKSAVPTRVRARNGPRARAAKPTAAPTLSASESSPADTTIAPASVSELSLIEQAQAVRSHSDQALSLLGLHERLYPQGALAQEREVLAIEVLLRRGDLESAKARASRFASSYPSSAHLPKVRALLARPAPP